MKTVNLKQNVLAEMATKWIFCAGSDLWCVG